MPRPIDGWAAVGSVLGRVLLVGAPGWVRLETVAQMTAALASLRADALAAIDGADTTTAPTLLGMGRTQYMAARAAGGWLSLDAPPGATLAEVFAAQDARRSPGRPRSRGADPVGAEGCVMGTDLLAALRALALPHASAHARDVLLQLLRSADRPPAEVVDLAARRRG